MSVDDRIAFLTQDKMDLDRYPLKVRFGSDEHDRNMLSGACAHYIAQHRKGLPVENQLWTLESDVAAFLSGGATKRRANKQAREFQRRATIAPVEYALNLATAYRPEVPNAR